MSFIRHLTVGLAYSTIAVAVGFALPRVVPNIDGDEAVTAGGVVLLAFMLLHEILSRHDATARLRGEVDALRRAHRGVMEELTNARGEVGRIHDALTAAVPRKGSKQLAEDVSKVVAEVRLLQTLVNQLSEQAAPTPRADPKPSPAGAEAARESAAMTVIEGGKSESSEPRSLAPVARDLDDESILRIIQDGLRRDRVDLVLQPIVSLPQRKRKFLEAFTRIRADDDAIIVPEQYIAIAEREGLITAIDNMLLFRCVQILRNMHGRERNVGFFCNISPYTLADRAFFGDFVEFMSENAELAPNLIFEFAQATISNRDEDILRQLGRLAAMGFRFSMDQVASLNLDYRMLARQHFRFVKIEAETLLREVGDASAPLNKDVRDLKRTLERHGVDLIVEKIESEPMLLELLDYHIDFGQGYLFGEPRLSRSA